MLAADEALALTAGIVAGENFIIAGAPGAGKTALGNAILGTLPRAARIGIIEDTAEMVVTSPNQFRLEARQPTRLQPDMQPVTIAQLIRHSLRYRADVLCIGEVRGEEAWDLLQLLNTGHRGSLCTIHANSADDALARFATCVLQSGVNLPYENIKERIGACVNRVLYVEKDSTGIRRVREHISVRGYDLDRREYRTTTRTAHTPEPVEV
jgi:pilus assembly protein CpaF